MASNARSSASTGCDAASPRGLARRLAGRPPRPPRSSVGNDPRPSLVTPLPFRVPRGSATHRRVRPECITPAHTYSWSGEIAPVAKTHGDAAVAHSERGGVAQLEQLDRRAGP